MAGDRGSGELDRLKAQYPDKFLPEHEVFAHIRRGDRIFLGTACGEPQHLVHALTDYVKAHPKAFFDAEIIQVWTLGVAPYTDEHLKSNFRLNAFFIGNNTRVGHQRRPRRLHADLPLPGARPVQPAGHLDRHRAGPDVAARPPRLPQPRRLGGHREGRRPERAARRSPR